MSDVKKKSWKKDEGRIMELNFGYVKGLPPEEWQKLNELKMVYDYHKSSNRLKRRYYNGKITLREVNLGIALQQILADWRLAAPGAQKRWMSLRHVLCSMDS